MIDAAGIGGHGRHGRVAQQRVQRNPGAAGGQIPEGDIETGQSLIHGAGFVGLKSQNTQLAGHLAHKTAGVAPGCAQGRRQNRFGQQSATVFGAAGGEIAPGFAPAAQAVLILHAQQHGGPVVHDAEGGAHRRVNGRAENKNLSVSQGCGGRDLPHGASLA